MCRTKYDILFVYETIPLFFTRRVHVRVDLGRDQSRFPA